MGPSDWLMLVLLGAFIPVYSYVRRRRLAELGDADRRPLYIRTILSLGLLAALVIWVWGANRRAFVDLGFALPPGTATTAAGFVCLMAAAAIGLRFRTLARMPQSRIEGLRERLGSVAVMLPRTRTELAWFFGLSIAAGTAEELLYRGYVFAVAAPFMPWPAFLIASSLAFGLGHLYQGVRGVIMTSCVGLFLGGFYLLTDSILWPMLLHALIDVNGGVTGYLLLRRPPNVGSSGTS